MEHNTPAKRRPWLTFRAAVLLLLVLAIVAYLVLRAPPEAVIDPVPAQEDRYDSIP